MALDEALEGRIGGSSSALRERWPRPRPRGAARRGNRKQALVPEGATVLEPVGTAPGLVVPPAEGRDGPVVVVLPGPAARAAADVARGRGRARAFRAAIAGATEYRQQMLRLFGIPESEIAETLRVAAREGVDLDALEITTCLRRGEVEVVTRYEPPAEPVYDALRGRRPRAPRRHAVLRRRLDRRRAGRRPAARARLDGRHRRVVHRRPAGRAPDRARGLLGLRPRRPRRLRQRGQGGARRRRPGADRAPRRGLDRGRRGARRRRPLGARRRRRRRDHRASPGRAAARRRSRSGPSASRSPRGAGDRLTRRAHLPAAARTSATARRRSRCTSLRRVLLGEGDARAQGGGPAAAGTAPPA